MRAMPRSSRPSLLTLALLLALALGTACDGDQPLEKPHAVGMVLTGPPPESAVPSLLSLPEPTLYERLEQLREAAENDNVRGLFLRVHALEGAYAAQRELARALARVRKAGKPVHCYFDGTDNAGFALLASSCDRITMPESGLLDLTGVRAQAFFAGDLLEKLGVSAELMQVGRFKGAAETFTASAMPDTTREALTRITDALQGRLVDWVQTGRSLPAEAVKAAIDEGPLPAHAALARKLVDDLGFEDEAQEHLRRAAEVKHLRFLNEDEEPSALDVLRVLSGEDEQAPAEPHVVLVPLNGTIVMGSGDGAEAADNFIAAMKDIRDNEQAAALVVRIDSPGGSAVASDLMWHALHEVGQKKPVFVSVGDMAASGGYYIASAAKHIVAEPTSLVGSIGVVGGKISIAGLADKLGVTIETLRAGRNAGFSDPTSSFTASEREALGKMLHSTYDLFLKRIEQGRSLSRSQLDAMAQGRIHTADAAKAGGLVDSFGGLLDTLELARKAAKLSKESQVHVWRSSETGLPALLGVSANRSSRAPVAEAQLRALLGTDLPLLRVLHGAERVAASLPFALELR